MAKTRKKEGEPTVIKKYANRRLYDTGRSSYVTLDDLCIMVKEGHDFVVFDAKTGEDLTHSVLTQIIVEQESKGENLLPIPFLRQLIGFYGDKVQALLPNYLEQTLETFSRNQEQFRDTISKSFSGMLNPVSSFEELNRQNMALFEQALRVWSPFTKDAKLKTPEEKIKELKDTIEQMEKEINRLSGRG